MTGSVIHIYKEGFSFNVFGQEFRSTLEFLYLSRGLGSGYRMMGIVIYPKNARTYSLFFQSVADYY